MSAFCVLFADRGRRTGCTRLSRVTPALLFLFCVLISQNVNGQNTGQEWQADIGGMPSVTVSSPVTVKAIPSTFVIPINMVDVNGVGIQAFQFNILYDQTKIDPSGVNFGCSTAGTLAGAANLTPTCNVEMPGRLLIGVNGAGTTTGSGTILNLSFTTDGAAVAGTFSDLTFENVFFFTATGHMNETVTNGRVYLVGPTAASVSVSGRVLGPNGMPVPNVLISLADTSGALRQGRSNPFGYYRFDDVPTGSVYILSANSKRFTFAPRVISVGDDLVDIDLIAEP